MIRTSGYIISSILLLLLTGHEAVPAGTRTAREIIIQADILNISVDTDHFIPAILDTTLKAGIRFGFNLARPFLSALDPSTFELEAVADMNLGPKYFAVAEAGLARRNLKEPTYHLRENGIFIRMGADNNFYRQFNDVIAVGARLGFSLYDRAAPSIIADGDYWGEYSGSLSQDTFFKQWAEVVFVLKTEIFRNVYLGWNLRGKVLLFGREDRHMQERYIPGFGIGETNSNLGFDFYIYYRFPVRTINRLQNLK